METKPLNIYIEILPTGDTLDTQGIPLPIYLIGKRATASRYFELTEKQAWVDLDTQYRRVTIYSGLLDTEWMRVEVK